MLPKACAILLLLISVMGSTALVLIVFVILVCAELILKQRRFEAPSACDDVRGCLDRSLERRSFREEEILPGGASLLV